MLDWEWYDDLSTFRLFTHLLLRVNYEKKKWRGIEILPGQIVTGRKVLSEETGLSERQVRTAIKRLKSTNELTSKTTNKYTVFTIVKWIDHQENDQQNDQQTTNKRPANDQQTTTTKEIKNIRKKEVVSKLPLTERQTKFYEELKSYTEKYTRETLRAFYDYWTEPNQNKTKLRYEMEKTWDTPRRLANWARRENNYPGSKLTQNGKPRHIPEFKSVDSEIERLEKLANQKLKELKIQSQ